MRKWRGESYEKKQMVFFAVYLAVSYTHLADIVTPTYQMLDAGFADTPAGQWLSEHAAEYGFVLRYPQDKQEVTGIIYESWHYRFVGKTHAKLMKESGLCLEEYLQQELPEGYTGASDPYDLPKQS